MTDPDKAKVEVLDVMADEYDDSEMVAVTEAVERMRYKWEHHG